ncbi:uncharacterized protein BO88DRAFT_459980 [Aspergillus vadensis CBS 113365]|uniref:Uncharacterized protein n=1 Tax=Aspergillus vadensis (strain CBS 113365 / IMI 142717 / IBT 24658) TaxID=1448311 RepID=A0A319BME1_ASPVC|nr:hypothetical protein BO88DRAFT_459980 [Aspergillus vadensis CBS 113365]PYH74466.1 hypothetical protein BO88DRAFT_459980 [Aspergillus vadensis CBS 113365]
MRSVYFCELGIISVSDLRKLCWTGSRSRVRRSNHSGYPPSLLAMKIPRLRTSRKRGTFAFRGSRRPRTLFHPCQLQDCGCSPPGDFRWELLPLRLWTLTSGLGGRVESLHLLLRVTQHAAIHKLRRGLLQYAVQYGVRNNINHIRMRPRARGHGALREREGNMPSYTPRTIQYLQTFLPTR